MIHPKLIMVMVSKAYRLDCAIDGSSRETMGSEMGEVDPVSSFGEKGEARADEIRKKMDRLWVPKGRIWGRTRYRSEQGTKAPF